MCAVAAIPTIISAVAAVGVAAYSANQQKHALEDQLKVRQKETDDAAGAATEDRLAQARQQRAAAKAAAAESGAAGNSTDAILNDLLMQSGRDVSRIEKNRENGQLETLQQARSQTAEINGQLGASVGDLGSRLSEKYAKYKIGMAQIANGDYGG
jgi:hypothetical protein